MRNAQDELTLHNYDYPGVVYLEAYPLMSGLMGLGAIAASLMKKLPKALSPSLLLLPWFIAIALHSGIDLFHEFYIPFPAFDTLINHLDEAAEMLTAMAGFLYVYLNANRLKRAR